MMATQVVKNGHHGIFKELVILGILELEEEDDWEISDNKFRNICHEPLDELLLSLFGTTSSPVTAHPKGKIHLLYSCIFPQIFECLTTIQQTKLRAVCRKWNAVLTSASVRRVVSLCPPCRGPDYSRDVCQFAACLYNCWTQQAKVLVLYGGSRSNPCEGRLDRTVQLLQRIITEKRLPAAEMVLLSREWHFDNVDFDIVDDNFDVPNWMTVFCDGFVTLARVCQQVILNNTGFNVELQRLFRYAKYGEDCSISIDVRFAYLRITRQLTTNDFWTAVNNGLTDVNPEDVERLGEWMSNGHTSGHHLSQIRQIIHITQTLDPRDGTRYRGLPYFDILSSVDVRQLTKFTLHALLQCFEDFYGRSIVHHVFP